MLNRSLSIVFEEYFLETHPSQNIFWTLIVNCVWRIFPRDPSIPEYILNHSLSIVSEKYFLESHPSQNIFWTTHCQLYLKNMLNRSMKIVVEEYFLQIHPSQNICWITYSKLCLKNISYRPTHPRKYVEPLIVNCAWRIFPTDPSIPEYMLNCSLSIVFEEYFLQTHPPQNICWIIHWKFCLKNISYRSIHPRIYVESLIVNCVWRIFPTDPSIPENMLNRSLLIVLEEYFLQTHPPQNICWTAHCQLCLKNISYRPIHHRIYVEPLNVNYVWKIFHTDPFIPEYILNHSLSVVFE